MRLLRSFPVLASALVLLGIVSLCLAQKSLALLLVAGVLAAMSWYVTEGPRGRSLPKWTSNVLIIAVSLAVLVDFSQHRDDVMGVLGRFIVWLTLIKLYQRKAPRDYAQLLSLSLLLVLLGCAQSTDLLFAAALLLYAILGVYVLLLFQLHASYERTRAARLASIPGGYRLVPPLKPILGHRPGLHFRTLTAGVGAAGLITSAVLFVIFPRDFGRALIGNPALPLGRQASFARELNLTSSTRITGSRKVVFKLRLPGRDHRNEEPLRLRGAVLDRYEGDGRWTATRLEPGHLIETAPPGFVRLGSAEAEPGPLLTQEFEVLSPSRTLFSVYVPVSIATKETRTIRFDPLTQTLEDADPGRLRRYAVKAQPAPSEATMETLTGGQDAQTSGPTPPRFHDPGGRVQRLARGLLEAAAVGAHPPVAADDPWGWNRSAAGVLNEFFHAGGFTYDTDLHDIVLRSAKGLRPDPTVQFLFDTKRGHCEYFASALAALCHGVGVPARLVTGYVALEYHDASRQYIVRESNAHAWVEVQTGPHRWETFDSTPPATLREIHGAPPTLADRLRSIFDRFEVTWRNEFVAFDRQSQANLIQALELGWTQRLTESLRSTRRWMARVNRAFYFGPAGYIWMGIVALALMIGAIALGSRMRRSLRIRTTLRLGHHRGADQQRMIRQLGFYLDMLTVLRKSGCSKPTWQPPLQYAHALAGRQPGPASLVREIATIFYSARYGRTRLSRETVDHAQSLVKQLASALEVKDPPSGQDHAPAARHRVTRNGAAAADDG
ncbi:MAG: transglutaminase TgpA family protein [Planctomycetota bacterium]|jgi:transglutaminase-like putative cysteine protease